MEIKQIQELVKNINAKEILQPVLLVGSTGIGKSESIKELVTEERKNNAEYGFVDLRLAQMDACEVIGYPYLDKETNTMKWARPSWFPKEGTKGILALEEINRSPDDVRQAIFQLLTEWRLNEHILPKGWSIVGLINPNNGNYQVNQLCPAMLRRFLQIYVEPPNTLDWAIWAKKNGVSENSIMFSKNFPKFFSASEDISVEGMANRATLTNLDRLYTSNCIPNGCLQEVANGLLGLEGGTAYVKNLRRNFEKPISAESIMTEYPKVKDKIMTQTKTNKNDLLYYTMIDVLAHCETKDLTKKNVDNFGEFLLDISEEMFFTIVHRLTTVKEGKLLFKFDTNKNLISKIKSIMKEVKDLNEK